jgi:hypothetical protein
LSYKTLHDGFDLVSAIFVRPITICLAILPLLLTSVDNTSSLLQKAASADPGKGPRSSKSSKLEATAEPPAKPTAANLK